MHVTPNLVVETILNTTLISRLGTLESKRHRYIAEGSKGSDERCLLLVLNCHLDLMISRISIQKTQSLTTRRGINDLLNTGESKRINRASFVKIRVIHTHTPRVIFLKNQPLKMKNL